MLSPIHELLELPPLEVQGDRGLLHPGDDLEAGLRLFLCVPVLSQGVGGAWRGVGRGEGGGEATQVIHV